MNANIGGAHRGSLARLWLSGAFGIVALTLAVVSCYGMLALSALLPLLGVRLLVDPAVWGGAIVAFTVLTVTAVFPGVRGHRSPLPAVVTLAGGGLILYALLVDYRALTELAGFVLLITGVVLDVRLRRRAGRGSRQTHEAGPARR